MKDHKHFWESDIRRKVTEHEFDYEPGAWEEMSNLLDEVSIPTNDPKGTQVSDNSITAYWKPFLFIVVTIGLIALFYTSKNDDLQASNNSGKTELPQNTTITNDQKDTGTQQIVQTTKPQNTRSTEKIIEAPVRNSSNDSGLNQNTSEVEEPDEVDLIIKEEDQIAPSILLERSQFKVAEFLPATSTIQLLEIPKPLIDLNIKLPKQPKRKRDRTKLYPDVIENY